MKLIKRISILVVVLVAALPAVAQFHVGPRVGATINSIKFNEGIADSENLAGFTGGIQAEFTLPILNLGCDASVMYVHRKSSAEESVKTGITDVLSSSEVRSRDYIEIPINLKYKIGLPVVSNIVTPYIFTGPSFSFLASKKAITEAYENKSVDVAWNVGVGVQLFSHLQIGASYGFGLTNTIQTVSSYSGTDASNLTEIDGKNKYWTVTAAWLF